MRLRFLLGLDSLFRHYLWIGVAPLVGGLIALGIGALVWPEIPPRSLVYGLAGMSLGTCIGILALRILKNLFHPLIIERLAENK